ncbi:MAG: substrate-binding periplasmic protein, partial [Pirellulales bacterium]
METVLRRIGITVAVLVGCLLPAWATSVVAEERQPLRFCFSPSAMPRAGKLADGAPQGVDVEVAKILAAELNRRWSFYWCANDTCRLQNLRANRCDVVIGLPHESVDAPDIAWAKSYAAATFGLVVAAQERGIRSPHELRDRRVGLVRGTVPLSPKHHKVFGFSSRAALLRGFRPT